MKKFLAILICVLTIFTLTSCKIRQEIEPYEEITLAKDINGNQLYDDRNQPISKRAGQLIDSKGYPLISSDARPCFYKDNSYYTYDGLEMSVIEIATTTGGSHRLFDNKNKQIHSIINELLSEEEIYFLTLRDGITIMPAIAKKTIRDNTVYISFYDMNNNRLSDSFYIKPNLN